MKSIAAILLALLSAFLSGCIPVPIPHQQWLSPRFHGLVVDAATGAPLKDVKVTLRDYGYVEEEMGAVVSHTDEKGSFLILASRSTMWTAIWLGPAEGIMRGTVRFERAGYEAFEEKKSMFGSAYARPDFEVNVRLKQKHAEPLSAADPSGG